MSSLLEGPFRATVEAEASLKVYWKESKPACRAEDTWFPPPTAGERRSFQCKLSLLNKKEFLSCASKSVFKHARISFLVRGFWELLNLGFIYFYFYIFF